LRIIQNESLNPLEKLKMLFSDCKKRAADPALIAISVGGEENIDSYEHIYKRKVDIILPQFEQLIVQGCESGHFDCPYPKEAAKFCVYGEMGLEARHKGSMDELIDITKEMYWRILGVKEDGF
jgi:hypothetical protein